MSGDLESQLQLFASMDSDGSGGLDRDEFVQAALVITDDMFTQWVDHVLYQDVLASDAERAAQVCCLDFLRSLVSLVVRNGLRLQICDFNHFKTVWLSGC